MQILPAWCFAIMKARPRASIWSLKFAAAAEA
jgi:hypothetical protein